MGLAASQARLLLLTARKSDLEYRSQIISQRKLMLAMETESLATEYTRSMSNKRMDFVFEIDANEGETLTQNLSYGALTVNNAEYIGNYIVTDSQGNLMVPGIEGQGLVLPAGFKYDEATNTATCFHTSVITDGEGNTVLDDDGNPKTKTEAVATYPVKRCDGLLNDTILQNALRNGGVFLEKFNNDKGEFESIAWQSTTCIEDTLNTEDDDLAQMNYETESLKFQNQDKMLDLELKNIETQHKAIETEVDSVKKVIEKNIEESYKIFA